MKHSKYFVFLSFALLATQTWAGPALPDAPKSANDPGSKIYTFEVQTKTLTCQEREVDVFFPHSNNSQEKFPVVVYGHGQALSLSNYQVTLEHLAKKGIIAIFPTYDSGFFDQDWTRMGEDYVNLTACALQQLAPIAAVDQVVFSGHSKGAYVAGVAAGLAYQNKMQIVPKAVVLFEPAGVDPASLAHLGSETGLTVVFADQDSTVKEDISAQIYVSAPSHHKQYITVKSYTQTATQLVADHFWPLTQGSFFGGGPESALHYYGEWRWLGAAAFDLQSGGHFTNPYLYGSQAVDKGLPGFEDGIKRNFGSLGQ